MDHYLYAAIKICGTWLAKDNISLLSLLVAQLPTRTKWSKKSLMNNTVKTSPIGISYLKNIYSLVIYKANCKTEFLEIGLKSLNWWLYQYCFCKNNLCRNAWFGMIDWAFKAFFWWVVEHWIQLHFTSFLGPIHFSVYIWLYRELTNYVNHIQS